MKPKSLLKSATIGLLGAAVLVVGTATAAFAHVTISVTEQAADAYTVLTFSVPHGCDASATTEVRIQIPEEIPQVTPTVNPNWDVAKVMEDLAEPIEAGHGEEITERVAEVVYTAHTPLPSDLRDAFELSLRTPDLAGETLYFPVVQLCEEGDAPWVELPTADVPADELEMPAPYITLVAGGDDGHGDSTESEETEAEGTAEEVAAPVADPPDGEASGSNSGSSNSNTLSVVALIVGGIGVVLGGVALAGRRRST